MILRDVLLVILVVMLLTLVPTILTDQNVRLSKGKKATLASGIIILLLLASFFARSGGFGVDTITYAELLSDYCRSHNTDELDLSYRVSLLLINAGMLGACQTEWLPGIWALIISAFLFCLPVPWPIRLRYVALLLFSLIGIELTTNALRQGFSIAVCVLSVAHWNQRRLTSLPLALAAVVLHPSTGLVLLALAMSTLAWRWFILGMALSISLLLFFIQSGLEPLLLQPLLFEIQKYMAHDADEVWIRILAMSSVLGALLAPLLCITHRHRNLVLKNQAYVTALRIGLCCLPFLGLPYFGYRIIYGLYPLVLYFTMLIGPKEGLNVGRHFALLLCFNTLLLLTWAQGSSYMRDIPFFN